MKALIVFDNTKGNTTGAAQNLRAALGALRLMREANPELKVNLQVRVCILELLPEDKPLDDYLTKVDQAGQRDLALVRSIVASEKMPEVTLELIRGVESEAAQLVAKRANEWGAEQIYTNLCRECSKCTEQRLRYNKRPGFLNFGFTRRQITLAAAAVVPVSTGSNVEIEDLLNLTRCRVVVTCHGELLMTIQKHFSRTSLCHERVVYERIQQY